MQNSNGENILNYEIVEIILLLKCNLNDCACIYYSFIELRRATKFIFMSRELGDQVIVPHQFGVQVILMWGHYLAPLLYACKLCVSPLANSCEHNSYSFQWIIL